VNTSSPNSLLLGVVPQKITDASYLVSLKEKHNRGAKDECFCSQKFKNNSFLLILYMEATGIVDERNLWFVRSKLKRKGVVTIIPDYTLSPNTDYDGMANKLLWFNGRKMMSKYKGNPNAVFVTGRSAGGI
jgi:tRNA splicing ligase